MKFLPPGFNTIELEKKEKNKWRWQWLGELDKNGRKWDQWLRKTDIAGIAFCECCQRTLKYGSSGKKLLKNHGDDKFHLSNQNTVLKNQVLPGSSKATDKTESMVDRVARQRAITTAFISEHCLPFSIANDLINLAKRLGEDKLALEKTTLSSTSATYITTHGIGKCLKMELSEKVKDRFVSLNLDEATNKNNDKILNILIQYYDESVNKTVIDHLGSRIQNVSTAEEIVKSIESVLKDYQIRWNQVISVLMDNCSTMRRKKGGVETLIRQKNTDLLDISGDTIHMISNVAKTLMKNIDNGLQSLCSDLYYDIEESPKVKELTCQVMMLMNAKKTKHLLRPISSRFLQMQDVSSRVLELLDYITIYYAAFLTEEEKTKYRPMFEQIYTTHGVGEEAQAAITLLQMAQEKQQKSQTSNDRKDRILSSLFTNRTETITVLNLCRGLLSVFQDYVKRFQNEAPQIHLLHEQMVEMTKTFLSMFIKTEFIPDRVSKLMQIDVTDRSIQKKDKELSVGKFAVTLMTKARMDKTQRHWVDDIYTNLRTGYVLAAKKLLQLPINNKTLRALSVLDPQLHYHSQTAVAFKHLANCLPAVVTDNEIGSFHLELNTFAVDKQVVNLCEQYKERDRVDVHFWAHVFELETFNKKRYPVLSKLVCALLSVFSGPIVEGTFNIMGDIIEDDRSTMAVENYEAVAIIKTALKRQDIKSHKMQPSSLMKKCVINAYSTYKIHLVDKKKKMEQKREEKLNNSIHKLKLEKVKHLLSLKRRLANKDKKRKHNVSSDSRVWKRIKCV